MKKGNKYGYDSSRWVEREKRKTNWEGPKKMTEKGRKQDEKNRRSGDFGRVRSYEERSADDLADLESDVKADEDRPLFLQDRKKRRADSYKAARRRETRARGLRAIHTAERASRALLRAIEEAED